MSFLIIVLGVLGAKEVTELEPLQALYNDYNCSYWNLTANPPTDDAAGTNCSSKPFCYWSGGECHFDTCLRIAQATWSDENSDCNADGTTPACKIQQTNIPYADADTCADPDAPVIKYYKVCRFQGGLPNHIGIDSCTWEYLNSSRNTCDKWKCAPDSADGSGRNYCGTKTPVDPKTIDACSSFATSDWCKLSPYCYWDSTCQPDYCTNFGVNCDTYNNTATGTGPGKPCSSFSIFDASAASGSDQTKIMCVDASKNASPNKCFDLGVQNNVPSGSGLCTTYTLPKCSANEECIAEFPTSGPFAGYYCGDASHTAGASILQIPFLLLLSLVAFFAF